MACVTVRTLRKKLQREAADITQADGLSVYLRTHSTRMHPD